MITNKYDSPFIAEVEGVESGKWQKGIIKIYNHVCVLFAVVNPLRTKLNNNMHLW